MLRKPHITVNVWSRASDSVPSLEPRLRRGDAASPAKIWGKSVPGRWRGDKSTSLGHDWVWHVGETKRKPVSEVQRGLQNLVQNVDRAVGRAWVTETVGTSIAGRPGSCGPKGPKGPQNHNIWSSICFVSASVHFQSSRWLRGATNGDRIYCTF